MDDHQKARIEPLKGSANYSVWHSMMKRYLKAQDVWDVMHEPEPDKGLKLQSVTSVNQDGKSVTEDKTLPPVTKSQYSKEWKDWDKGRQKAAFYLFSSIDKSIQSMFDHIDDPQQLWDACKSHFLQTGFSYVHDNLCRLTELKLTSPKLQDVEKYHTEFHKVHGNLVDAGAAPDSITRTSRYIHGLGKNFDTWTALKRNQLHNLSDMPKLDDLMSEVTEQARGIKMQATFYGSNPRNQGRQNNNNKSQSQSKDNKDSKDKTKDKDGNVKNHCSTCDSSHGPTCYYKEPTKAHQGWEPKKNVGRFKDADLSKGNTWFNKNDTNKGGNGGKQSGAMVGLAQVPVALSAGNRRRRGNKPAIIVDSGARVHIINDSSLYCESFPHHQPIQGVDGIVHASLIGTVRLPTRGVEGETTETYLTNVICIESAPCCLMSTWILEDKGAECRLKEGEIRWSNKVHATFHKNEDLETYLLDLNFEDFNTSPPPDNIATDPPSEAAVFVAHDKWHSRFGHIGDSSLLATQQATKGLDWEGDKEEGACDVCEVSKSKAVVSRQKRTPPTTALTHFETDILSITPESTAGNSYLVPFRCMKTHVAYSYPAKTKGQAFDITVNHVKFIETQYGHKVKLIMKDQDKSFGGNALVVYTEEKGMMIQESAAYTHYQNGGIERFNAIIAERITCLLISGLIPVQYWEFVADAATHLYNRTSQQSINGKTPSGFATSELLGDDDARPSVAHLKVYGCKAFVNIPKEQRVKSAKFRAKANVGKLIGYQGSHNYHIWMPDGRVITTPSVTFDESTVEHPNNVQGPQIIDENEDPEELYDWQTKADIQPSEYELVQSDQGYGIELEDITAESIEQRFEAARPNSQPTQQGRRGSSIFRDLSLDNDAEDQEAQQEEDGATIGGPGHEGLEATGEPVNDPLQSTEQDDDLAPLPNVPRRRGRPPGSRNKPKTQAPSQRQTRSQSSELNDRENDGKPASIALLAHVFLAAADCSSTSVADIEPNTLAEALKRPDKEAWVNACKEELSSIRSKRTYTVVDAPAKPKKVLGSRWVLKRKHDEFGRITRYKARFCVQGFSQRDGIDYLQTFASVAKNASIKIILALAALFDWELDQTDVVTAFLNGLLEEEIYVKPPEGFEEPNGMVWLLNRALYGLKQSPRMWYKTLKDFLATLGFKPLHSDHAVFIRQIGSDLRTGLTILVVYVDDFIMAGTRQNVNAVKAALSNKFSMKDMGPAKYFLGIEIWRDRTTRSISLSQKGYSDKILAHYGMTTCRKEDTPMNAKEDLSPAPDNYLATPEDRALYQGIVGHLGYLTLHTRPDLSAACNKLARHLINPTPEHITRAKRVLRYLSNTKEYNLTFSFGSEGLNPQGYTDSAFADETQNSRSTSAYLFTLNGTPMSWATSLQKLVATSSCEAEYIGLTECVKEALWIQAFLLELGYKDQVVPFRLFADNTGAIAIANNPEFHKRTKHINNKFHFVRQHMDNKDVVVTYLETKSMPADGLTKCLDRQAFNHFLQQISLIAGST